MQQAGLWTQQCQGELAIMSFTGFLLKCRLSVFSLIQCDSDECLACLDLQAMESHSVCVCVCGLWPNHRSLIS